MYATEKVNKLMKVEDVHDMEELEKQVVKFVDSPDDLRKIAKI